MTKRTGDRHKPGTVMLQSRTTPAKKRRFKSLAARLGSTEQDYINQMVDYFIDRAEETPDSDGKPLTFEELVRYEKKK